VFLSPHFPPTMHLYVRRLREAGASVFGIADAAWDLLEPELTQNLTEYFRVDDLHSLDQLVRAVAHFTARHGKMDRLESLNEYWLENDARPRTRLTTAGPPRSGLAEMS